MSAFNGHTEKAGHFLQPTASAIGQSVMAILPQVALSTCYHRLRYLAGCAFVQRIAIGRRATMPGKVVAQCSLVDACDGAAHHHPYSTVLLQAMLLLRPANR